METNAIPTQLEMEYNLEDTLASLSQLNIQGNIIPHTWFSKITFENNKPDLLGIMILAEVLYWYRPVEIRDETTGALLGLKKKFKNDMLQRSISSFAEQFGVSYRQIADALKRLSSKNLLYKENRTVTTAMGKLGNVLFLAPVVREIANLQSNIPLMQSNVEGEGITNEKSPQNTDSVPPLCNQTDKVLHSNAKAYVTKRGTYTENTTEITTKKKAAGGVNSNNEPKNTDIAPAPFFKKEDIFIHERLSERQKHAIQEWIHKNPALALQFKDEIALSDSIAAEILNPDCFKKAGNDFHYKFNCIKKQIQANHWFPVQSLNVNEAIKKKEITILKQKISELETERRSNLHDLHNPLRAGHTEFLAICEKAVKKYEEQLKPLYQALKQCAKNDATIMKTKPNQKTTYGESL